MIVPAWVRYLAVVLLVLGALFAAYRHGVTTERTRASLAFEVERSEAARLVIAEQNRSTARAAELDDKYTGELNDAYERIKDLERPGPGAEPVRLFVRAACPSVPAAGTTPGVGAGSEQAAQLDEDARPDYFALLREIRLKEAALALCVESSQKR